MPVRICFFDACLGWVGRICAAARRSGRDLTFYNLGVRRDTTADVLARWQREAEARLPSEHDGRFVFSFGANDCCPGEDIGVRVASGRALANAEAILTAAVAWRPTLMVGPLPICDAAVDRRTYQLSNDFAALCARLRVPYLEVFDLAVASDIWAREIAVGDGVHPNEGGYTVIARAVENRAGWRAWIDRAALTTQA